MLSISVFEFRLPSIYYQIELFLDDFLLLVSVLVLALRSTDTRHLWFSSQNCIPINVFVEMLNFLKASFSSIFRS